MKADLKELELNLREQMSDLRESMASLHENMAGLHETYISIQKTSLHKEVADIKGGWLVRFMGPALVGIVTGIAAAGLTILVSNQLP